MGQKQSPLFANLKSNKGSKRATAVKVSLTSLIDAFSILVIYLLVNFSTSGEILYLSKDMELPTAAKGEELFRNVVIKVEDGKYFVENQETTVDEITGKLISIRKNWDKTGYEDQSAESVTIQADRRTKFEGLSPAIQASGQAGFSDIHFAVVQK